MPTIKSKVQLLLTFTLLFVGLSVLALMNTATADETGTRTGEFSHTPSDISIAAEVSGEPAAQEYVSPEFTANFTFNGIGLSWSGPITEGIQFALQIDDGDWYPLEMQGADAKDQREDQISAPLFASGSRVRYKISGAHANTVQNVHVIYFDSTIPPYRSLASTLRQTVLRSVQSSTAVISRADWGADETYRTWEPDYQTPEKIVIHHSAGGDGGDDPAATIRGIYYWHAVVLGWGDIGYNYVIDPAGHVYEGRYGGDGAIGAHAYNSETNTNYNAGSIGVMLMGCYEETEGACATVDTMTEPMQAALVTLVAEKSSLYHFDPAGESDWYGDLLPNVLSHRDVDSTYCPGSSVYRLLDVIRSAAHDQYHSLHTRRYAATYSGSTIADRYTAATTADVSVRYANTGRKRWNKNNVVLQIQLVETGERHRLTLTDSVEDGNVADIIGALTLPTVPGDYTLISRLYRNGSPIHGSKHATTVTVENPYGVKVITAVLPLAIQQGWKPQANLVIRNTGSLPLPVGSTIELDGNVIATTTTEWPLNEKRSFEPTITAAVNWPVGDHAVILKLKVDDITVADSRTVRTLRVDSVQ